MMRNLNVNEPQNLILTKNCRNSTKRVLVAVYGLFYIYFKNICNFIW